MNKKRRHFKMACIASVAVLLGACSSTPDVNVQDTSDLEVVLKQPSLKKTPAVALAQPKKPVLKANRTSPVMAKIASPKRVVKTRKFAAAKQKPVYTAKKSYVPPKPIVVAVHSKPISAKKRQSFAKPAKRGVTAVAPESEVMLASNQYKQAVAPLKAAKNSVLRKPTLPRASAAMMVGAPVIRPATVPRSRARQPLKRTVQNQQQARIQQARLQQAREQQLKLQQAQQNQARAQWQKEQQALAYRTKWQRNQQLTAQQQARLKQAQVQQQARAQQQVQAQQARLQLARQQQARQQQAKVQQASYQPRVNNSVLRRPANNYSQSSITGDFAGNPRAPCRCQ